MRQGLSRIAICGLLLIVSGVGCASSASSHMWAYPHANEDNITMRADDHRSSVARIIEIDRRGLIEDLDIFFLTDRPSRLTRWHTR